MSNTLIPPGEALRRAIQWISDERTDRPVANLVALVEAASVRFGLSPAQEEWLLHSLDPSLTIGVPKGEQ
jgi:hypothetical protein